MKHKAFTEAIQIAGAAAVAAVGSITDPANQTPENMSKIAGRVFEAVFMQIEKASENGHDVEDEKSETDPEDDAR